MLEKKTANASHLLQCCFAQICSYEQTSLLRVTLLFSLLLIKKTPHFHVSDEEYPKLPPLPLSSPPFPTTVDSHPSSERNICQLSGEERQNLPTTDISSHHTRCTACKGNDNIGLASVESVSRPYSQGFNASQTPENQHLQGCYSLEETFEMAQPFGLDKSEGIHTDPDPVFTSTSSTSSRSPTLISNFQDLSVNTRKPVNESECGTVEEAAPDNANLTVQGLEKTVDRIVQEIHQEKYRFDSVYHPKKPAKGLY